jgi:hypothetical protein
LGFLKNLVKETKMNEIDKISLIKTVLFSKIIVSIEYDFFKNNIYITRSVEQ